MRGATNVTLQTHQILRLPRKMTAQHLPEIWWKQLKRHFQCAADPNMIRDRSENEPVSPQPAAQTGLPLALRTNIFYWKIQCFALRLSFQIPPSTAPATKSATWPSPSTAPVTKSDTWPSPSTAPATKSDTWTSPSTAPVTKSDTWPPPSTAPATQNDSHAWSSSHMKRHFRFQCEEQQMSPSKLTKYCACHAKWPPNIYQKFDENSWNVISNARPIRAWSETVPRMNPSVRNPPRKQGYLSRSGRVFSSEKYNVSRSGYLSKFHQVLRLPRKVPLDLHQILRLSRKVTLQLHQVLRLPRKVTLELHQVLRLSRKVTLDLHQVLRLPHRMTRMLDPRHIWNVISNARSNKCHPPNSPNTAPATQNDHPTSTRNLMKTAETSFPMRGRSEHDPRPFREWTRQSAPRRANRVTFRAPDKYFLLKNTMFRAPAIFPNSTKYCACHEKCHLTFTKYCACHEKWHFNFTKYCAYHEKWHLNFTKYCAYHEKWHLNFTKYCAYHEKWHLTFTKYCACHTEWLAGLILVTYETSFPMRGATNVTLQTHQILRLPRKMNIQHLAEMCGKQLKRHFQCAADPRPFRAWSDHVPRPFPSVRNPPRNRGYFSRSGRTVCIEKYNISRSGYLSKSHQVLRLPRKVTLELHQVLRLPRKVTLELHQVLRLPRKVTLDLHQVLRLPHRMTRRLDPRHIWNVISNARRNKCHPPNSPNTAPATQNDHPTSGRNLRKTAETSFPMRGRSEHDPRPFRSRSETVSVSPQPATQPRLLFALRTNGLYWKIQHFALRLSFQISPSTAPATKSDTWTSPSTAPTTKSDTWTSPSTAPTTKRSITQRFYSAILWLYYYSAIYYSEILLIDSTTTQRLYLTLLLRSDCTWLYYYAAIVLDSTTTQRLYLTPLLRSDCTWLYSYAAIVLDSTITQRLYLTLLLRSDCTWLYYYAAIVLDSTLTQRL